MKKKQLIILPCVAAITIATYVGKKTFESNVCKSDYLLLANVEALANREINDGYFVHHMKYYDPTTNLETKKCIAICYLGPNGPCISSHKHGPEMCCSISCMGGIK